MQGNAYVMISVLTLFCSSNYSRQVIAIVMSFKSDAIFCIIFLSFFLDILPHAHANMYFFYSFKVYPQVSAEKVREERVSVTETARGVTVNEDSREEESWMDRNRKSILTPSREHHDQIRHKAVCIATNTCLRLCI